MLAIVRVLRVVTGLIAVWQIVGLLPVLTTWLPNLERVTGGMWAIAFLKFLVLLVSGGLFVWLGKVKNRIDNSGKRTSDGRLVIYALLTLSVAGIAAAIVIPAISNRSQATVKNAAIQPSPAASTQPGQTNNQTQALTETKYSRPPTFESEGWTQESTGSKESGPWLNYDPPGTRYSRFADGTIYRLFPPGVRPSAEKANPFALMDSSDRPPQ